VPNVAIAGPRINCGQQLPDQLPAEAEIVPHVQSHAFTLRSDVAMTLIVPFELSLGLHEMHNDAESRLRYIQHAEIGISRLLKLAGFQMASREQFVYYGTKRFSQRYCYMDHFKNKKDLIFYKFGGTPAVISCEYQNNARIMNWMNHLMLIENVNELTNALMKNDSSVGISGHHKFCREPEL